MHRELERRIAQFLGTEDAKMPYIIGIGGSALGPIALRTALRNHPELHGFFDENRTEPFFVKNLERLGITARVRTICVDINPSSVTKLSAKRRAMSRSSRA